MAETASFESALDARVDEILDRCTRCGACVEACPMPAPVGLDVSDPKGVVGGVLDILKGGAGTPEAARWAAICSGSGNCIPACHDGVNPRFMLTMARLALQKRKDGPERRRASQASFVQMTRGVRVLSRLQLSPELLARFGPEAAPASDAPPDLVFYTGCNLLKTPHIALLCLDVLDALEINYRVAGGPASCCGVLQTRGGDLAAAGRVAYRTLDRFGGTTTNTVLSWCPTCQVQLGETVLPSRRAQETNPSGLEMEPLVIWLDRRLDELKRLMVHPVNKRVALHDHPGVSGAGAAVRRILEAIPGLDFVDLEQLPVGYMCNTLRPVPAFKRDLHQHLLEAASAAGVDTLAGVYHACHRELCAHERDWPFEVVNFMELIGAAMGLHRPDLFKRLKMLQDVDAVIADSQELIAAHGLDLEEVRSVIIEDML
ncbi:MAG: (Fe-S)-binding protein, partial [Proteobacteria bacterium]|nr:(Fe-S)-binding protein [Pseudomonadota bacterium]